MVVILQGRYAGKKAVVVRNFDDGTHSRRYGHAIVTGLSKEPKKVRLKKPITNRNMRITYNSYIRDI